MNRTSKSLFNLLGCCDANPDLRTSKITQKIVDSNSVSRFKQSIVHSFSLSALVQQQRLEKMMQTPNLSFIPTYPTNKQILNSSLSSPKYFKNMTSRLVKSPSPVRFRNLTTVQSPVNSNGQYFGFFNEEKKKNKILQQENTQLKQKLNTARQQSIQLERSIRTVLQVHLPQQSNTKSLSLIDSVNLTLKHFYHSNIEMSNELKLLKKGLETAPSARDFENSMINSSSNFNYTFAETINSLLSEVKILNEEVSQLKSSKIIDRKKVLDSQRQITQLLNTSAELGKVKQKYSGSISQIQKLIVQLRAQRELKQKYQMQLKLCLSNLDHRDLSINQLKQDIKDFTKNKNSNEVLDIRSILELIK